MADFQFGCREFEVGSVHDFGPDEIVYKRSTLASVV
jgi:hypothetical protein